MKLYRKLKALFTGNKPCTFETSNGHYYETQRLGMRNKRDVGICKCKICGKNADYDFVTGKYITNAHHTTPEFDEHTIVDITRHPDWIQTTDDLDGTIYVDQMMNDCEWLTPEAYAKVKKAWNERARKAMEKHDDVKDE